MLRLESFESVCDYSDLSSARHLSIEEYAAAFFPSLANHLYSFIRPFYLSFIRSLVRSFFHFHCFFFSNYLLVSLRKECGVQRHGLGLPYLHAEAWGAAEQVPRKHRRSCHHRKHPPLRAGSSVARRVKRCS